MSNYNVQYYDIQLFCTALCSLNLFVKVSAITLIFKNKAWTEENTRET
jgi:hypothetical protein